jgi:hypothetical protein
MIQKIIAACLEFHTYNSREKNFKVLFQMTRVIIVFARLR